VEEFEIFVLNQFSQLCASAFNIVQNITLEISEKFTLMKNASLSI
jgi:hypothetical protein